MKTLKEISKTGIPDTKWCSEEDVKKMFDDYNKKLKDRVEYLQKDCATLEICNKEDVIKLIDKLSKEVMGE